MAVRKGMYVWSSSAAIPRLTRAARRSDFDAGLFRQFTYANGGKYKPYTKV
jgi:hypothetical protein